MGDERSTVAFDVIGTLFSLERMRESLVALGAPETSLELWFAESLRDYFALSHSGHYAPLKDVLSASLPRTLEELQVAADDAQLSEVVASFAALDPVDGAAEACATLADAGWKIVALTNGSEELTSSLLLRAGIDDRFDAALSCDSIRVSKPHPRVYAMAKEQTDGELWMVAAHGWDVAGAKRAGLMTAWISAKERRYPSIYPPPDVVAPNLATAAREIVARRRD